MPDPASRGTASPTLLDRFLNVIERAGNKLPDPAMLFVIALLLVWVFSALLAPVQFAEIDPRNGEPIRVQNLLTGTALATFLATMVNVFVNFPPLGIVLVAMLGVGVAEHVGFIGAGLKAMLNITPRALLTPMLILVACLSHTATDAGYVLVIPLGGIIFYAAGRHPVAGIAAAFITLARIIEYLLEEGAKVTATDVDEAQVVDAIAQLVAYQLTDVTVTHRAAIVTLKLVAARGRDPTADAERVFQKFT